MYIESTCCIQNHRSANDHRGHHLWDDALTNQYIVIEFHDSGAICVGDDVDTTRHFHFSMNEYDDMCAAIDGNLKIRIRAKQGAEQHFTRCKWEAVAS